MCGGNGSRSCVWLWMHSYGARDEIVGACKKIASEVARGETSIDDIDEELVSQRMLTAYVPTVRNSQSHCPTGGC